MELKEISTLLEKYKDSNARLTVLFVEKNRQSYQAFKPEVSNPVQKDIIQLLYNQLNTIKKLNLEEHSFNPSGQETDTYSVCHTDYVGNYSEVMKLFEENRHEELDADQISFLIFRLRINKEEDDTKYVYFFRRNHKLKSIRKGFWIQKISETYTKLESNLIGIDGVIDAISYDNELAFFSHFTAERFFNLKEKFLENAVEVLTEIEKGNKFENFEEFREDCLGDARVTRRLTKMRSNPKIIELFHKHFSNAEEVVELFDLNITFNQDKTKIIYTDKNELTDISMLMRDAYYRTVLADRKGIDDFN